MDDTQAELPEETIRDPVEKEAGSVSYGSERNGEESDQDRKKEEVEVEVLQVESQQKELPEIVSSDDGEKQNEDKGGETGNLLS